MSTGDPMCQCPLSWWGTVPPWCPVHNPWQYTTHTYPATTTSGYLQLTTEKKLTDDEIKRIAAQIVELLKAKDLSAEADSAPESVKQIKGIVVTGESFRNETPRMRRLAAEKIVERALGKKPRKAKRKK